MSLSLRKIDFTDVSLYAVTPDFTDAAAMLETIEKIVEGGADAVQLRSRALSDREFVDFGRKAKRLNLILEGIFLKMPL